ncbi:MAG: nucleotidyltransferase domain-containing protein [Candidatus Brocadiaceae bacterium]|nr:nucleotidyltransferase domain-containing protein [Candidatus Brocadiaceae bacterium]
MRYNNTIKTLIASIEPYGPERIYLFGSWARDEQDDTSDIDIVLIKETNNSFFERLKEIVPYMAGINRAIDILIYTPQEFQKMLEEGNVFAEMIQEEGVIIYEKKRGRGEKVVNYFDCL